MATIATAKSAKSTNNNARSKRWKAAWAGTEGAAHRGAAHRQTPESAAQFATTEVSTTVTVGPATVSPATISSEEGNARRKEKAQARAEAATLPPTPAEVSKTTTISREPRLEC